MTYSSSESSVAAGQPVGLIDLACGSTAWRYTSAAVDLVYGGHTYLHQSGMKIHTIEHTRNVMESLLEIDLPWSCPYVRLYPGAIPDGLVAVVYTRGHDPDYEVQWRGFVVDVERRQSSPQNRRALVRCAASAHDTGYAGFCLRPGKLCQVPLYHPTLCGVRKAAYTHAGVTEAVAGDEVTCALFATQTDGYFRGGEFAANGITRMMIGHAGDTVTLSHAIGGLAANVAFTATAGCAHTRATCDAVFNNLLNNKGYEWMSHRNPFIEGVL